MSDKRIIEQMFYPETQNTFCDKKKKRINRRVYVFRRFINKISEIKNLECHDRFNEISNPNEKTSKICKKAYNKLQERENK